jgi:hypothetical protein
MSRRIFAIAVLALLAGAVGAEAATTKVKVVNGRSAPALVMDQTPCNRCTAMRVFVWKQARVAQNWS